VLLTETHELLTLRETADLLRLHPWTLYGRTAPNGGKYIPHVRIGNKIRFRRADVLRWMNEGLPS
jgi:excisionase family DNA binding protein